MLREKFLYIDTTDKIMGIPVKHIVAGVGTSVLVSFSISSLNGGLIAFLLVPLSGYFVYRISVGLERTFLGTSFLYYRKWLSSPQVLLPLADEESIPLIWDEAGQGFETFPHGEGAKGIEVL